MTSDFKNHDYAQRQKSSFPLQKLTLALRERQRLKNNNSKRSMRSSPVGGQKKAKDSFKVSSPASSPSPYKSNRKPREVSQKRCSTKSFQISSQSSVSKWNPQPQPTQNKKSKKSISSNKIDPKKINFSFEKQRPSHSRGNSTADSTNLNLLSKKQSINSLSTTPNRSKKFKSMSDFIQAYKSITPTPQTQIPSRKQSQYSSPSRSKRNYNSSRKDMIISSSSMPSSPDIYKSKIYCIQNRVEANNPFENKTQQSKQKLSQQKFRQTQNINSLSNKFGLNQTDYFLSSLLINNEGIQTKINQHGEIHQNQMAQRQNDIEKSRAAAKTNIINVRNKLSMNIEDDSPKKKKKILQPPSAFFSVKPRLIGRASSISSSRRVSDNKKILKRSNDLRVSKFNGYNQKQTSNTSINRRSSIISALIKPQKEVRQEETSFSTTKANNSFHKNDINSIILDMNLTKQEKHQLGHELDVQKRDTMVNEYVLKIKDILEEKELIYGCKPVVYREKFICSHDRDQALYVDYREKRKCQKKSVKNMLQALMKKTDALKEKPIVFQQKKVDIQNSGLIKRGI